MLHKWSWVVLKNYIKNHRFRVISCKTVHNAIHVLPNDKRLWKTIFSLSGSASSVYGWNELDLLISQIKFILWYQKEILWYHKIEFVISKHRIYDIIWFYSKTAPHIFLVSNVLNVGGLFSYLIVEWWYLFPGYRLDNAHRPYLWPCKQGAYISERGTFICAHAWIFFKLCILITHYIRTMKIYLSN